MSFTRPLSTPKEVILMKKLKVSKAAIAVSTAVLMTTSLLTPVISASSANRLTLTPDKYEIKPGDRIAVSLDYVPSDSGIAGFTIDVHYDPNAMSIYVPDKDMSAGSAFSVVTNNEFDDGVIKIVGANMRGTNVSSAGNVTTLYFDVKDTCREYGSRFEQRLCECRLQGAHTERPRKG